MGPAGKPGLSYRPSRKFHVPPAHSTIEEGDPEPTDQEEQQHEREGEDEPGAEIHHITLWKETGEQRKARAAIRQDHQGKEGALRGIRTLGEEEELRS